MSINRDVQYTTDTFMTPSRKELSITFIKHASLCITYEGLSIQVDPVMDYVPYTDYSKMPKADVILITHDHYDHLDAKAIEMLEKQGTIILGNKKSCDILGKGIVMHNGDTITLEKNIVIEAVPAYNTTPEHLQYHPKGRDNGYILNLGGMRIYIAGDTENISEMLQIKNIDIAMLPVNQPYTMTIDQVVSAANIVNPKILYPYHFNNTPVEKLQQLLANTSIDVRIRNME